MTTPQIIEQSISIQASIATVDHCITDPVLMHRWLNPLLRCDPVGEWSTQPNARTRFIVQTPLWQPTLRCTVSERKRGLIVWEFEGFLIGCDRWECRNKGQQTILYNCFEFRIPHPLIQWGYQQFAARWTQQDMQAQLQRIKQLCETKPVLKTSPGISLIHP